jgi:hypothetical protein
MNAKMKKGLAVLLALVLAIIPMMSSVVFADTTSNTITNGDQIASPTDASGSDASSSDVQEWVFQDAEIKEDGTVVITWVDKNDASKTKTTKDKAEAENVPATCSESSKIVYTYRKPNGELITKEVEGKEKATGHKYDIVDKADARAKDAKCLEPGAVVLKCSDCGDEQVRETLAPGHDIVVIGYEPGWNIDDHKFDYVNGNPGPDALRNTTEDGYWYEYYICLNEAKGICSNDTDDAWYTTVYKGVTYNVYRKTYTVSHLAETDRFYTVIHTDAGLGEDKDNTILWSDFDEERRPLKWFSPTPIVTGDPDYVTVDNCAKEAHYVMLTLSNHGNVTGSKLETIPAGTHSYKYNIPSPDKNGLAQTSSENVVFVPRVDADGDPIVDGQGRQTYDLVNYSCKSDGWAIVQCDWCGREYKKAVPANTNHVASATYKYENDTATCTEDGTIDQITVCAICDKEMSRKQIKSKAKGHAYPVVRFATGTPYYHVIDKSLDPTDSFSVWTDEYVRTQTVVTAATKHYAGEAKSEVLCTRCGEALAGETKTIVLPATDPFVFDYDYVLAWAPAYAEDAYDENESPFTVTALGRNDLDDVDAVVIGIPKDEDIVARGEVDKFTRPIDSNVIVTHQMTFAGTSCEYAQMTFTATVTRITERYNEKDLTAPLTDTKVYNFEQRGYKGHQWTTPYEKDGNTCVSCIVCGDEEVIHYGDGTVLPEDGEQTNDIAKATIVGAVRDYNGKKEAVPFTVVLNGKVLEEGKDYVLSRENAFQNGGSHPMTITGKGEYTGEKTFGLVINRREQKLKIKTANDTKALTVKTADLEEGNQIFWIKVAGVKASLEDVKVTSNSKYVTVTPSKNKAGYYKVTVSKGVKVNGTYRITAKAPKTNTYAAGSVSTLITVK